MVTWLRGACAWRIFGSVPRLDPYRSRAMLLTVPVVHRCSRNTPWLAGALAARYSPTRTAARPCRSLSWSGQDSCRVSDLRKTERYGMRETQDRACEAARPPQPPRLSPSPFRSGRGDTIVCDGRKAILSGSIAAVRAQRAGTKTPGRNAGSIGALPARRLTRALTKRLCPAFVTSGPAPCAPAMVVPCRNENGRRDGYRAGHSC